MQRRRHGDFHAELVRGMRLALADALDLRGVQAVDPRASAGWPFCSLVLALGEHPFRQMQWTPEDILKLVLAGDLPDDVADGAAEIGPEPAQRPVGTFELVGMGIALMLDQRELADPP